jgi:hypothetical protein
MLTDLISTKEKNKIISDTAKSMSTDDIIAGTLIDIMKVLFNIFSDVNSIYKYEEAIPIKNNGNLLGKKLGCIIKYFDNTIITKTNDVKSIRLTTLI